MKKISFLRLGLLQACARLGQITTANLLLYLPNLCAKLEQDSGPRLRRTRQLYSKQVKTTIIDDWRLFVVVIICKISDKVVNIWDIPVENEYPIDNSHEHHLSANELKAHVVVD